MRYPRSDILPGATLFVALLSLVSCAVQVGEPQDAAANSAAVQSGYDNGAWQIVTEEATSVQAGATGALNLAMGMCGATFLSPHFAVTAAHCVPNSDGFYLNTTVTVAQYETSALDMDAVDAQAVVNTNGGWPDWTKGDSLYPSDGYHVTAHTCHLEIRCASPYWGPNINCPSTPPNDIRAADIALIHCPNRSADADWVTAINTVENGQALNVWWFHEYLDLPTSGTLSDQRWAHYGHYEGNSSDNYHYTYEHQLLPLKSDHFPNGTLYHAMGRTGTEFMTDVPICHGTSGSGVFGRGSTQLYGPAVTGPAGMDGRLCADMNAAVPGTNYMNATHSGNTAVLSDLAMVTGDR